MNVERFDFVFLEPSLDGIGNEWALVLMSSLRFEDGHSGETFPLEGREATLTRGIVVAISQGAHALGDPGFGEVQAHLLLGKLADTLRLKRRNGGE